MATLAAKAADTTEEAALTSNTAAFLSPKSTQQMVDWDIEIAGVADGPSQTRPGPLLEVPASAPIPDLLNSVDGYAASKWVSGMLLEKVAADDGLAAYVHRLAHFVGDDTSELDAIGMLTQYSLFLCALPLIEPGDVTGQWDFVMAQDVARDVVHSAIESATGGETPSNLV
ncbi:hypothetical protein F4776DRAFT_262764 [Hypoxylon sp. NC0597]|nr:hypothetical protein F4776DRAFT_262764 [Hypoxylon sp. NC0597]